MSSKIVILGSGGRLGAALARDWRAAGDEVIGIPRAALDIGDFSAVRQKLTDLPFDTLVNCAAQTNVDRCESETAEAWRINGEAVGILGEICAAKNARCVHLSTDYVFDGEKAEPYTETDAAEPISVYGASKLDGEKRVLAASAEHLVARVSWVFGPDRPSFIDQILERARTQETLSAIADKVAVPTYTQDAAQLLRALLAKSASGIFHLCNRGACTWQEYGQFAIDCALAADVPLVGRHVTPLKMADLKAFIARRPIRTAMSTEKLTQTIGFAPRPWQEAVSAYVHEHFSPK